MPDEFSTNQKIESKEKSISDKKKNTKYKWMKG